MGASFFRRSHSSLAHLYVLCFPDFIPFPTFVAGKGLNLLTTQVIDENSWGREMLSVEQANQKEIGEI